MHIYYIKFALVQYLQNYSIYHDDNVTGRCILCSFTQLTLQNLFSKYSKGTLPDISEPHWKHLKITLPDWFIILRSAARAR